MTKIIKGTVDKGIINLKVKTPVGGLSIKRKENPPIPPLGIEQMVKPPEFIKPKKAGDFLKW